MPVMKTGLVLSLSPKDQCVESPCLAAIRHAASHRASLRRRFNSTQNLGVKPCQ